MASGDRRSRVVSLSPLFANDPNIHKPSLSTPTASSNLMLFLRSCRVVPVVAFCRVSWAVGQSLIGEAVVLAVCRVPRVRMRKRDIRCPQDDTQCKRNEHWKSYYPSHTIAPILSGGRPGMFSALLVSPSKLGIDPGAGSCPGCPTRG